MLTTPASWGYVLWTHRGGGIRSAGAMWLGLGTALRAMRRGGRPLRGLLRRLGGGCDAASWILERVMPELTAYSFKLRKNVVISDPKLVILKNGRPAVRGVAQEDPNTSVFRIVSAAEAEKLRADGITEEES